MDKNSIINSLSKTYELSNTCEQYEDLVNFLNSIKINNLVNYYNYHVDNYDHEDKIIIEFIIRILQNLYNNSGVQSPVTDEDYDMLYEIFLDISDNSNIVGGKNKSNEKRIVNHNYPDLRGTLDKIHFISISDKGKDKRKSLEEWINSVKNKLGRELYDDELEVAIYPKFDGVSVIFECDKNGNVIQALTRGDTKSNEAVSVNHILGAVKFIPYNKWEDAPFAVKTEVVMSYTNFKKFCDKYGDFKSPRSAVSSIINSKDFDIKQFKYLTIMLLRMQNFYTKEVIVPDEPIVSYPKQISYINDYKSFLPIFNQLREFVKVMMDIPIDGIVLQLTNRLLQNELGRDDAINKFEVAYKFLPESKKTTLLDVSFCMGILGTITPVAKISPVKMEGNTINNVSLGSMDRFESLHLRCGDEVYIKYDIIPYLFVDDTCTHSNEPYIEAPKTCEYCGSELLQYPVLRCVNNDCPSRMIGKIVNYTEKMNIENISIGIITSLFERGFLRSIQDLYNLKNHKEEIINLSGFGAKSFNRIIKSVDKRKEVYDFILLGSIGIPDIGPKIFKNILNIYYIDDLTKIAIEGDVKKLTNIHGIKERTALKIITGILLNMELIQFLQKTLIVKHDKRNYKMKVLFTKVRDKDFEKYLDTKEIEVCSGYNKNIDIVICDNINIASDKINKAKRDGKKILTIKEAYSFFKYK